MVEKAQARAESENPIRIMPRSTRSTEGNKTGSWRYLRPRYEEKTAPCSAACPAGEDIGKVEMLTSQGLFKEAWETILRENPFPGVCGRVCTGGRVCRDGSCACPSGQTLYAGACVDLRSSAANCGACGLACAAGQVCSAGACAASCA